MQSEQQFSDEMFMEQSMASFSEQINRQIEQLDRKERGLTVDTAHPFSAEASPLLQPHSSFFEPRWSAPIDFTPGYSSTFFGRTLDSPFDTTRFTPISTPSQTQNDSTQQINPQLTHQRPSNLTLDFSFLNGVPMSQSMSASHLIQPTTPFLNSPSFTDESCTPSASNHTRFFQDYDMSAGAAPMNKYTCPHLGCNRGFPRSYNLKSHMLCHTGLKPHHCTLCKSAFARKHDLQRHLRTLHSEKRDFACTKCMQRFGKIDALERHLKNEEVMTAEEEHACLALYSEEAKAAAASEA